MGFIGDVIAGVLALFFSVWASYGFAIILLTVVVMLVVTPLTFSSTKSMMQMQRFQPEIKRIQSQFSDDRQQMNEEMMAFYRANNINPAGACLPLLIQMPIFLVLFNVLRGLTRRTTSIGLGLGDYVGQETMIAAGEQQTPLTNTDFGPRTFNPAFLNEDSSMFEALSNSTEMVSFGVDLSRSFTSALGSSVLEAGPYLLMIVIIAFTGWFQQRQIQGRNPEAAQNPQMKMVSRIMLIFLPIISLGLPGGILTYFITSNAIRVGQQAFITHRIYKPAGDAPIDVAYEVQDGEDDGDGDGDGEGEQKELGGGKTTTKSSDGDKPSDRPGGLLDGLLGGKQESRANHGRRPTTSRPKPKPKPKPKPASGGTGRDGKGAGSGTGGGSRRVTPKGEQSRPSNRSKKKRKRK